MSHSDWLEALASQEDLGRLLAPAPKAREDAGYGHTLAEICQQPATWTDTACRVMQSRERLAEMLEGCQWLILTGSGSSQYAGECVHPILQRETGIPASTLGGGWLLVDGAGCVPPGRPALLVSLARSGDSPESAGVVDCFREADSGVRHLIITCNSQGRLATRFRQDPHVMVLPLDPRTNDRSLVMTSSFTNMVIASRALGLLRKPDACLGIANRLARAGQDLLLKHTGKLARVARGGFRKAVYLASGCRFGAAREAALKMLEMNSGRLPTMAETYLGLRHGPMCWIDSSTLLVCFLDSEPLARAYEEDLLAELKAKELGARKVVVGEDIPSSLLSEDDVALEIPGLAALGDANAPVIDAVAGQVLAFFRCLAEGLRPDTPSSGVISRVVNEFTVHRMDSGVSNVGLLVIGDLNPDLILSGCHSFPRPGREVLVEYASWTLGSASAICAVGLARLGNTVRFAGKVGRDQWGDFCIRTLEEAGVEVAHVRRDSAVKTGLTVSITSAADRALVTYLGAIASLRARDLDTGVMDGCTHLHVSSYFLQKGLRPDCRALFAEAHARGLTTSLDPGFDPTQRWEDGLRETLREVDVFFPNEVELRGLGGSADRVECLRRLDNGRTLVIAKLGAEGCLALANGKPAGVAAFPVEPVDTTGAGDSFDAGFLHAWVRGRPLEEAMRFGAACGALSTRARGGTGSQATAEEAQALLNVPVADTLSR